MTKPPPRTYEKTCAECGKPFTGRRSDAEYCNDLCAARARYRRNGGTRVAQGRKPRPCMECGETFAPKRTDSRFCSVKCNKRFYYEENRARMNEQSRKWALEHPAERAAIMQRHNDRHGEEDRAKKKSRYRELKADPRRLEAHQEYHRQWYEAHRDEVLARAKRRRDSDPYSPMSWKHGTDWRELISSLMEKQEGKCYLCGDALQPERLRAIHLDHDHACCPKGRSCEKCRRGLACAGCNTLIGHGRDDPGRLRRIADNLERANAEVRARMAQEREVIPPTRLA